MVHAEPRVGAGLVGGLEAVLRQAVRDSLKVQLFESDDLLHHLATHGQGRSFRALIS